MSYTPPPPHTYPVRFETGHRLHGLGIIVSGSTVEEMEQFFAANERFKEQGRLGIVEPVAAMLPKIISWTDPRPISMETLKTYSYPDLFDIVSAYADAVVGVAAPLGQHSSVGAQSAEVSTEMEMSLASLSS